MAQHRGEDVTFVLRELSEHPITLFGSADAQSVMSKAALEIESLRDKLQGLRSETSRLRERLDLMQKDQRQHRDHSCDVSVRLDADTITARAFLKGWGEAYGDSLAGAARVRSGDASRPGDGETLGPPLHFRYATRYGPHWLYHGNNQGHFSVLPMEIWFGSEARETPRWYLRGMHGGKVSNFEFGKIVELWRNRT